MTLALVRPRLLPSELAPGLHYDVPTDAYHARELGVVSKHAIDLFAHAPALYRAWVDGAEEDPTPALVFGNAVDCATFEPARFAETYAIAPDFGDCRLKGPKASRDAWREEHKGRTWLSCEDGLHLRGMVAALHTHPITGKLLAAGGARQLTLRWDDPDHGLICKGRPDFYIERLGVCADLKTTLDASAHPFTRDVASYGYHRQEAHYREGFAELGAPLEAFVFIVVEKTPPYLVAARVLDEAAVDVGRRSMRARIARFADHLARNDWPGFPTIEEIKLPRWAEEQDT